MENKIKYANIEQIRTYTDKNGNEKYKYMVHQEHYDKENKRYNGWEAITIYSKEKHNTGETIAYVWEYNPQYNAGRYIEYVNEENLPFNI